MESQICGIHIEQYVHGTCMHYMMLLKLVRVKDHIIGISILIIPVPSRCPKHKRYNVYSLLNTSILAVTNLNAAVQPYMWFVVIIMEDPNEYIKLRNVCYMNTCAYSGVQLLGV